MQSLHDELIWLYLYLYYLFIVSKVINMTIQRNSIESWEILIGKQVRQLRMRRGFDQSQLSQQANISIGALKNLESGKGSSLKSLIAVLRALDAEEWLAKLDPTPTVSPLKILRDEKLSKERQRVYRPRKTSNV